MKELGYKSYCQILPRRENEYRNKPNHFMHGQIGRLFAPESVDALPWVATLLGGGGGGLACLDDPESYTGCASLRAIPVQV